MVERSTRQTTRDQLQNRKSVRDHPEVPHARQARMLRGTRYAK
jgi:hypothetical protein